MEETRRTGGPGDRIDLGTYLDVFRRIWWKALLIGIGAGIIALLATFLLRSRYTAIAVVTPVSEDAKPVASLGALSALGIVTGTPSKVEDLDTLFRSKDLTARVFRKNGLWPIAFPDRYDPKTGTLKPTLAERLFGNAKGPKQPGDWDAAHAAENRLEVGLNKRAGTVSVSFQASSAEGAAKIVGHYLEEGKSRLQEEALERARNNKKFIESQIKATSDPLTRERLYALYTQEVEREMMARNREQFGFKLIDHPWVPERKSYPRRGRIALLVMVLSFAVSIVVLGLRSGTDDSPRPAAGR